MYGDVRRCAGSMLSGRFANSAVAAYLEALGVSGKLGLRMSDKSPAESANVFCQTVWDFRGILISVYCLLTWLAFCFSLLPFSQIMYVYFLPTNRYTKLKTRQSIFGDHSR